MKTSWIVQLITPFRYLFSGSLLLVAACGTINLPPPEGRSLDERRRTLDEIPAAAPKAAESSPTGDAATPTGDAQSSGSTSTAEAATATPRSMNEAKALDDPELGIRLPLGIPTLKAGSGNRD